MEPNGVETEELLRRAGNGDDGAVRRLFERPGNRLRRVVAARLGGREPISFRGRKRVGRRFHSEVPDPFPPTNGPQPTR